MNGKFLTVAMSALLVTGLASAPAVAQAQPAGTRQAVAASAVRALPGGGHEYVYWVNGIETVLPVPPAGFDPDRAGAAQLREYGFPPKPALPAKLARWEKLVHLKRPDRPGPLVQTAKKAAAPTATSTNWSGYLMNQDPDSAFVSASASYSQPTYFDTCE
jgi:hypothetical protein